MSKLEDFIKNNASQFDDLKAPPKVWRGIEHRLEPKVHHLWKWSAIAAGALLLIAMGYIFGMRSNATAQINGYAQFEEAEKFYQARINMKLEKIRALPVSHDVMDDLAVLDEVYEQLRNELLNNPDADAKVLLAAMINHQKEKLEVLDKILDRVNANESPETNPNHEM